VLSRTAASGDGRAIEGSISSTRASTLPSPSASKARRMLSTLIPFQATTAKEYPANCRYGTRCRGSVLGGYLARTLSEPR